MILWYDSETFGRVPLKKGTYRYAASAEVMLVPYAIDDGPVECLDLTDDSEDVFVLFDLLEKADEIIAHNAMFDRAVLKYGDLKLDVPIDKWRCCMVKAYAHGLPGALDRVGKILNIPTDDAKLAEGKELIRLFCMPRPKNTKLRRATKHTHPKEWARFVEYAKHDISAMRAVWNRLPSWNYSNDPKRKGGYRELMLWHKDQEMNDRGIPVDVLFAEIVAEACEDEKALMSEEISEITSGRVTKATQRDKLLDFIFEEHGIELANLNKSTVNRLLGDVTIPPIVRDLLAIRAQVSKTSTAKYKALIEGVNDDGRLRGTIQFDGAARTRRDGGRTFQPQNLASRDLPSHDIIEAAIQAFYNRTAAIAFPDVMRMASACIRSAIKAVPGTKFCVADLANIEGRGLAWLAGEEWKLRAFKDYDTFILDDNGNRIADGKGDFKRKGPDLYRLAYAKAFGIPASEVDSKTQRPIGKVMELMLGYEGGIGAYITGAVGYNIDLEQMARHAWDSIPKDIYLETLDFLDWWDRVVKRSFPISNEARIVCEAFKRMWRYAHPQTVALWKAMKDNFINAACDPGETFVYRQLKFRRDGKWLRIQLPSGRCLCYPDPQVSEKGECSFMGINQYTRQWQRIKTHGGKLTENAVQSLSRDVLFDRVPEAEEIGYIPLFRVHDEVVTETPDSDEFSGDGLADILAIPPEWAIGFPLAAAGMECPRYRK